MESAVFAYFISIGAGLSFGLSLGAVPAVIAYRYLKRREGVGNYERSQVKKAAAR